MIVTIRESVAALKKQGESLDETVASKPTAATTPRDGFLIIGDFFSICSS